MTSPADNSMRNGASQHLHAASGSKSGEGNATTLIDQLLAEQRELTAVEMFSHAHDSHEVRGQWYRDLLPASPPGAGQQYAFEVDLDQCYGCKACVSACHSLNGLDEDESWRSVGLLIGHNANGKAEEKGSSGAGESFLLSPLPHFSSASRPSFQQHITTACHHCVDPGCLNGCPVLAYDKDPLTGIVRHLDDQCIGCQYCVMKCPYEVPQYSKARGIVRKCDMCSSRLAVGEAPACVQACPSSAISITVVEQAKVRGKYRSLPEFDSGTGVPPVRFGAHGRDARATNRANSFLPASPNPAITLPTTRFVTARTLPENLLAGDHSLVRRSDPHLPLVILLVLSQLAVGASIAAVLVPSALPLLVVALIAGVVAIAAGSLHLGQPLKAWRSFLGWRKSWFSREVIAMSGFAFLLALAVGAVWFPATRSLGGFMVPLAALSGLITVACSAMIYAATRRDFWNAAQSFTKFFGTTLVLGAAVTMATLACVTALRDALVAPVMVLALGSLAKLAFERSIGAHLVDEETPAPTPLNKTARLLEGELNGFVRARIICGLFGSLALPFIAVTHPTANVPVVAVAALALCVAGELLERYLFFTAVATQKMPGGIGT